jgi:competence protein ComEC
MPGGHSLLYDAGDKGGYCLRAIQELIPQDKIDLIVLSHSDADHIGELPQIIGMDANNGDSAELAAKSVGTILFPGDQHIEWTQANRREIAAIEHAQANGTIVWKLATDPLPDPDPDHRRVFTLGNAKATVIAGWSNGDDTRHPDEHALPTAEHNNAISIVIRFEYGGHSVLLTGDTVGRLRGDPGKTCAYAERFMRDHADEWPIRSDVLIGQHHGGDNATSNCFLRAVKPRFVVFSAGHKNYFHPTQKAANRVMATARIHADAIFRTDLRDNEGDGEWRFKSLAGCKDKAGDDDVEIILPEDAAEDITVRYRQPHPGC